MRALGEGTNGKSINSGTVLGPHISLTLLGQGRNRKPKTFSCDLRDALPPANTRNLRRSFSRAANILGPPSIFPTPLSSPLCDFLRGPSPPRQQRSFSSPRVNLCQGGLIPSIAFPPFLSLVQNQAPCFLGPFTLSVKRPVDLSPTSKRHCRMFI